MKAKWIGALKERKSGRLKLVISLGQGQPWGWTANMKKTRNQCEKDEWYSEAFGFSSALRVITISLSAIYRTYMIT